MLVRFDEIPESGKRFEIEDESWFPDKEIEKKGPVRAEIILERKGRRVFLEGTMNAELVIYCDRCLEPYVYQAPNEIRAVFELMENSLHSKAEHSLSRNEMDTILLKVPAIDVFDFLKQHVVLNVPLKSICRPDCKGLCAGCGANLNICKCQCIKKETSSPFSVLKSLKK